MRGSRNAPAAGNNRGASKSASQAGTQPDYNARLARLAGFLPDPDQAHEIEVSDIAEKSGVPQTQVWEDLKKRHPTAWHESGRDHRARFQLLRAGELKVRPLDWLVSGLFECNTLLQIFGDPGAAKTFMAIDLACSIVTGMSYHGRTVKKGPVVFIAGEGQNGLVRRLKAWAIRNNVNLEKTDLFISPMPAAMTDSTSLSHVIGAIDELEEPPKLVVLDTLARNFGPGDENSTQDMTAFVRACDELRITFGCTVALIHHTGHGDKSRARGSTVLNGAVDTAYRLSRDDDVIRVNCTKMKDAQPPEPFAFEFRTVDLGFENDDGTPANSAILLPTDLPDAPSTAASKNQTTALTCLDDLTNTQRENLEAGGRNPDKARVTLADWRTACMGTGMPRRSWYDVKDSLTAKKLINIEPGGYVSRRISSE